MHALGRHLLLELNGCNSKLLNDIKRVEDFMVAGAKLAKATIIGSHFHQFSPFGISGVVIIAESHVAIHTWPENRFAAVDVFSCTRRVDPEALTGLLRAALGAGEAACTEVPRGAGLRSPFFLETAAQPARPPAE